MTFNNYCKIRNSTLMLIRNVSIGQREFNISTVHSKQYRLDAFTGTWLIESSSVTERASNDQRIGSLDDTILLQKSRSE